jgi:hypothetical protein
LDQAFQSQKLFDTGDGLSLIVCRRGTGDYTLGVSNNSLIELPLRIVSKVGPIQTIDEIPLDQSEKKAIGYLPEGFENANIGTSGKNTIAGGDIRIFRVRVKEEGVEEITHITPPANPQNRFLPLRGTVKIQDEILTRPTFFQHYDGVTVDWKYLADHEKSTLKQEAGWLGLQKVRILVDMTSGINLFPDLRIVNNIEPEYKQSVARILDVVAKMEILGAHDLIIPLQRYVENNISREATWKSYDTTMAKICHEAESSNIMVYLRMTPNRPPSNLVEAMQFIKRLGAPNLKLAPSTALFLDSKTDPKGITSEMIKHIGMWIVNTPGYDLEGLRWNAYGPIAGSNRDDEIAAFIRLNPTVPIMTDAPYVNQDQEYLDALALERIMKRVASGK